MGPTQHHGKGKPLLKLGIILPQTKWLSKIRSYLNVISNSLEDLDKVNTPSNISHPFDIYTLYFTSTTGQHLMVEIDKTGHLIKPYHLLLLLLIHREICFMISFCTWGSEYQAKMPQSRICPAPCALRKSPLPPRHYICKVLH